MRKEHDGDNGEENLYIHVVCWAGSDRSKLIAEELNRRGYFATHGGVLNGQNYTTPEDLCRVGTIIFTDDTTRNEFKKDKLLTRKARANGAKTLVLCISEGEKEIALQGGKMDELKNVISAKLDLFNFPYKKMKY